MVQNAPSEPIPRQQFGSLQDMRIAVAGAGLIGRRHIEELVKSPHASLASIIDPSPEAGALAAELGVPHYATLERALADDRPDGVILATPNRLHVEGGLTCIAAGVPVIVEKPLAETAAGAKQLVEAAAAWWAKAAEDTRDCRSLAIAMSRAALHFAAPLHS